jgi:hypothetical protein
MPQKAQFTHKRVEYIFLFDEPLNPIKAPNRLKYLKLAWRFVLTSCDIYQNPFTQEKILKFWRLSLQPNGMKLNYIPMYTDHQKKMWNIKFDHVNQIINCQLMSVLFVSNQV